MIKVLITGIDREPYLGGIETYIYNTVMRMDKNIFDIYFLGYKDAKPCYYKELTEAGFHFIFITERKKNYMAYHIELNELFKKNGFDILHSNLNSLSCITPINIALKYGCRVIVHSHNSGCLQSKKSILLHRINYYRLPRKKIKMIGVSDVAGKWMFGDKSDYIVLNNGVDTERFKYSEGKRKAIKCECGITPKTILHVGAFREQKNHRRIISIFSDYLKNHGDTVLLLAGEGPLKPEIQQLVKKEGLEENVMFLDNRVDIDYIMSAADVLILPSFYEGFPIVLIEAQSSGLPCVISDVITDEALITDLCQKVDLDASNDRWSSAIDNAFALRPDRQQYSEMVNTYGFGIKRQTNAIEKIYMESLE